MRARDDLAAAFCRGVPDRVAEATELWLEFEQGHSERLPILRRLLHTLKGEAHMLDFVGCGELAELAESVIDAVNRAGDRTELTGDSVLGALEAIALVTQVEAPEEAADLEGIKQNLRAAADELNRTEAFVSGRPVKPPVVPSVPPPRDSVPPAAGPERPGAMPLRVDEVGPLMHELRRLFSEQEVFHKRLREIQRMLRALLVEIDPHQSPEQLLERVIKTLGYGTEIDRQLGGIRAAWSANEFSMGLTLEELEGLVGRASVVSIGRLLNQAQRVGRSTARAVNKEVDLEARGDMILDAGVEQRLEPALIHLVRNAVDHGIEPPEVRRARGKPARGRVTVSIAQTESSVQVEVADDGGGVNFDRLRQALETRVTDVATLSKEALLEHLFEHGVTTAEQVTSISGRGVGLDVVAREAGAAGGQVRIERTDKNGTTVVLVLPTTLRGELAVPVSSGPHRCAIPSRAIFSVIRVGEIEKAGDARWIRVRTDAGTELVRLCSLASVLGDGGEPRPGDAALVLYHSAGLFAIGVQSYENPRPINLQPAEELPFRSPLVRGVAPTPDGGVLLLLAADALYSYARGAGGTTTATRTTPSRQPCALVVEDAPVARELLCGILRSTGLRVEEAADGRQGLHKARMEPPDVILTDLEMPHMDGIQMITELRRSAELSRIPIIVLTTAAHEENQSHLARLGVAAVLSKQKFVEKELCELIGRCIKQASN